MLFSGSASDQGCRSGGVGELSSSPSPHPPLQPVSVSIIPSSAMPGMRVSFLREQSSPKPPTWATRLLMGWGFPQASSPSTLTLTSLRANDTLSALQPKEGTPLVPAVAPPSPPLGPGCPMLPAAYHPRATWWSQWSKSMLSWGQLPISPDHCPY